MSVFNEKRSGYDRRQRDVGVCNAYGERRVEQRRQMLVGAISYSEWEAHFEVFRQEIERRRALLAERNRAAANDEDQAK